jgi:hypothetical protein
LAALRFGSRAALACASRICLKTLPIPGPFRSRAAAVSVLIATPVARRLAGTQTLVARTVRHGGIVWRRASIVKSLG